MDIFAEKLFYPNYESSFLSHFKNRYNLIFIAFLPFFRIDNNRIEHPSIQKSNQISDEQLKAKNKEFAQIPEFKAEIFSYENENYPDDKTKIESGKIINWQETKVTASFRNFGEINRALKTSIGSYREVFRSPDLLERLNSVTEKEQIFHPNEGNFEPLIKVKIYKTLKTLNKTDVVVRDEFSETEKRLDLNTISVEDFVEKIEHKDY